MIISSELIEQPVLRLVGAEADKLGAECYVIGGWVRDLLLHRPSNDIDVVCVGSGIKLAEAVAKRLGRGAHLAVFKTYGTAQVKQGETEIEFVGARRESYRKDSRNPIVEDGTLEDDQKRRDFTINALAICLNKERYGELLDPFDGVHDLEACIIRTPLDPDITFSDDPLRMMRGIRFASQLGFYLNITTFEAIERNRERIGIITKERIAEELNKIMLSRRPSVGWKLLDKTGLLPLIFPELSDLKGVETKEGRGHKDVFLHTLQVLDNLSEHSDNLWLRWAALLHDIGKPRSKQWEPGTGWTFKNHNYIGAKMVPRIFRRMKLPQNEKMDYVVKMVDLHMRPINLIEDCVTDSAVRRLLFEAGDDIEDLMLLCDADITSKNEDKVRRYHDNYQLVRRKMHEIEEKDRVRNFQPPVDGNEIMELLHIEPCNTVGQLKAAVKDAILDGIIPNEHDAAKAYLLQLAGEQGLLPT
ncbi:MAG: HD domain-containing protein [Paludibacteraceae bacterium]|nr:HD domain-containing protein [Paludibacteraceae bacterium]